MGDLSDINAQHEFRDKLAEFMAKECKNQNYHVIAAIEIDKEKGKGFVTSQGTLKPSTSFITWRLLVGIIGQHFQRLLSNFSINTTMEFPIMPKDKVDKK